MWPDPNDILRWMLRRVWPWLCLALILGTVAASAPGIVAAAADVGPFDRAPGDPAPIVATDPCCECEADLAECEWDRAAWREQAVRCVDDVLEVKAR